MGFYSCLCAKTNLPVLADTSWSDKPDFTQVVVVCRDGSVIRGAYDGYGRVEGLDISEHVSVLGGADEARIVLAKYYAGERFEDLPPNANEIGQGHFHDEVFIEHLEKVGPLPSVAAYLTLYSGFEPRIDPEHFDAARLPWHMQFVGWAKRADEAGKIGFGLRVAEDKVMRGGDSLPGLEIVEADRGKFTPFEAEFIECAINEGHAMGAATEHEEEVPEGVEPPFVFGINPLPGLGCAAVLVLGENGEVSAYPAKSIAHEHGLPDASREAFCADIAAHPERITTGLIDLLDGKGRVIDRVADENVLQALTEQLNHIGIDVVATIKPVAGPAPVKPGAVPGV